MLVEVRKNETPVDTSTGDIDRHLGETEAVTLLQPAGQQYEEDIERVTSNCAFIDGDPLISGQSYNSTKTIRLTRRTPVKYTIKARKMVFEILETLKSNDRNKAMFIIYECFMDTRVKKEYQVCDEILHSVMYMDFDIRVSLSFLMASYSLKKHLSYRPMFYDMVCKKARMLNEYESLSDTLNGLR